MRSHNSLGPALRSFGPNPKVAILLLVVGTSFSLLAFAAAREFRETIAWIVFYLLATGLGLLILSHLSFRLWVHETGISYRGIQGYNEIEAHHFPLGTFHRLRLFSRQDPSLSIGERVHNADELTGLIQGFALQEMFRRALHEYENGIEVDLGRIRAGRKPE